jgi:hypothetical protein
MSRNQPQLFERWFQQFIYLAGIIFLITGSAKVFSATGTESVLSVIDPIIKLSFRNLFLFAGLVELVIAFICLFTKQIMLNLALVFWMAANFTAYRVGLFLIGWHRPCGCLGNLSDPLGIAPQTADLLMKAVLAVLLIGSGSLFFYGLKMNKIFKYSSTAPLTTNET